MPFSQSRQTNDYVRGSYTVASYVHHVVIPRIAVFEPILSNK